MRSFSLVPVLAMLVACGGPSSVEQAYTDLIRSPNTCRADAVANVSPSGMVQDFEVLERTLRRGYAGFELAGDAAHWNGVFEAGRRRLPDEPLTAFAFRDLLVEHFSFLDDNHASFNVYQNGTVSSRSTGTHHEAYVGEERLMKRGSSWIASGGVEVIGCEGHELDTLLKPSVNGRNFIPVIVSPEPVEEITCTYKPPGNEAEQRTIGFQPLEVTQSRGDVFERLPATFPWLRVRGLFGNESAMESFVVSGSSVRDEPIVVLDLRGNGGGSDGHVIRWFANLTNQNLRYWDKGLLQSEVTLQGALNFWECVRAAEDEPTEAQDQRIERAELELEQAQETRGVFREIEHTEPELPGNAPSAFGGRLVVLVNQGCLSACETAVLLARQVPGAIVIGENTGGYMKVGETRRYRLPSSGIWVSLGHQSHQDPTGHFRESYGFMPDMWMDGSDPEDGVRTLVACLNDESCASNVSFR